QTCALPISDGGGRGAPVFGWLCVAASGIDAARALATSAAPMMEALEERRKLRRVSMISFLSHDVSRVDQCFGHAVWSFLCWWGIPFGWRGWAAATCRQRCAAIPSRPAKSRVTLGWRR